MMHQQAEQQQLHHQQHRTIMQRRAGGGGDGFLQQPLPSGGTNRFAANYSSPDRFASPNLVRGQDSGGTFNNGAVVYPNGMSPDGGMQQQGCKWQHSPPNHY